MMKYKIILFLITILYANLLSAQLKYEKEHRIRKTQFPKEALALTNEKLTGAKKLKFYKEINGEKTHFILKFKKEKLWYNIKFTKEGLLKYIELKIKDEDFLEDSYTQIKNHLTHRFSSYKIKKMLQRYSLNGSVDKIWKTAFQNLITPEIKYHIVLRGKKQEYSFLYNAEGEFVSSKKSLPANHDHTLY